MNGLNSWLEVTEKESLYLKTDEHNLTNLNNRKEIDWR